MIRLVEIPDGVLDRNDLAMMLLWPPETMGFGYVPKFMIEGATTHTIFEYTQITIDPIFKIGG